MQLELRIKKRMIVPLLYAFKILCQGSEANEIPKRVNAKKSILLDNTISTE